MENPALLATYHGDVGPEILKMVSTAERVKMVSARCAQMVPDEGSDVGAQQPISDRFDELFNFTMFEWHNCRVYESTRGLTSFMKELRRQKGAAAARDNMYEGWD